MKEQNEIEITEQTAESLALFAPERPLSVDEIHEALEKTGKGAVKQSITNARFALEYDPVLADAIRFNEMTERIDIVKDLPWKRDGTIMDDMDEAYILQYLEENYELSQDKKIAKAITVVAGENRYHPVRDKLNSLVWDNTPRVYHALHHFFGAEENELNYQCLKYFMTGVIRRVFHPGCKFDEMFCLVGEQGAGKSTFFRFLAMNDDWFSDDLKNLSDENVYRKMQGHLLVELSEMSATVNARNVEEIRSFLSRQKDTYKIPYDKHPKDRKRQCAFVGTANNPNFLPFDRTGNRRFLAVETNMEQAEVHVLEDEKESRAYIEQMWAEVITDFRAGNYHTKLPKKFDEQLKEMRKDFMPEDGKAGMIQVYLDRFKDEHVCSMQILEDVFGESVMGGKSWQTREIGEIMNTEIVGWKKGPNHRFDRYGPQRSWVRDDRKPEKKDPEPKQMTIDEISSDGWEDATKVEGNPFLKQEEKAS